MISSGEIPLILDSVEIARELATAIWHMLTKSEPFAPGRPPALPLVA